MRYKYEDSIAGADTLIECLNEYGKDGWRPIKIVRQEAEIMPFDYWYAVIFELNSKQS